MGRCFLSVVLLPIMLGCEGHITGGSGRNPYQGIDTNAFQVGRLTSTGSADMRTRFQYDPLGREAAAEHDLENSAYVFLTTYGYAQGNPAGPGSVVVAQTFPDGEEVRYGYDA